MNNYSFSESSLKTLSTVDKRLQELMKRALKRSKVDFGIPKTGGLRTAKQQNMLFKAGSSSLDGYTKRSKHQDGLAVDVFAYVDGKVSYEPLHMSLIANAVLQEASLMGLKVTWGGLWKHEDAPHFQLEDAS